MTRPVVRVTLLVALVLPLGWLSASRLREDVTSSMRLRREPWPVRQRKVHGDWYGVVQQLEATLPLNEPVDVIMAAPDAWGVAVFSGSALAPRPSRFFLTEENWRRRERAAFVHDPRGVNAPQGLVPPPARIVLIAEENALRIRQ